MFRVRVLQVQEHRVLVPQMVRNLETLSKALRLHQDHLQLGGGVDVHNAASVPRPVSRPALRE